MSYSGDEGIGLWLRSVQEDYERELRVRGVNFLFALFIAIGVIGVICMDVGVIIGLQAK